MDEKGTRRLLVVAALVAAIAGVGGGVTGGAIAAAQLQDRLVRLETTTTAVADNLEGRALRTEVAAIGNGVVRIKLSDALEPKSGGFGGIQAFVETGSTAHGCIASVSETNVGNLGPFYVICTPRAPVIGGRARKGIVLQIRTASAGSSSGPLFPQGSLVEVTLWQPGAGQYAAPVMCVIGAPQQC